MLLRLRWLLVALLVAAVVVRWVVIRRLSDDDSDSETAGVPFQVEFFEDGWTLQLARKMPEQVSALATALARNEFNEDVFVGTGPVGGVYRFRPDSPAPALRVATGLGDEQHFGTCFVSALALRDLDRDGTAELLAETSQILPIGRPRLYVWTMGETPILRGMARPDIQSSWSHGLGFVHRHGCDTENVVSTFCGYGEIVEYQLAAGSSSDGFRHEHLAWRQVGRLPASGEGTQTADVDNDGETDVCLATGYSEHNAAIQVHALDEGGVVESPKHVLAEQGRFGNVKFLVRDVDGRGAQQIVAWWCTGTDGGQCEMIRYRLAPEGLVERTVITRGDAASLWPIDGQMTQADADRDGVTEVWFATTSGNVWRYDPHVSRYDAHAPRDDTDGSCTLSPVCRLAAQVGPIAGAAPHSSGSAGLYIASGQHVLRLDRTRSAPPPVALRPAQPARASQTDQTESQPAALPREAG